MLTAYSVRNLFGCLEVVDLAAKLLKKRHYKILLEFYIKGFVTFYSARKTRSIKPALRYVIFRVLLACFAPQSNCAFQLILLTKRKGQLSSIVKILFEEVVFLENRVESKLSDAFKVCIH